MTSILQNGYVNIEKKNNTYSLEVKNTNVHVNKVLFESLLLENYVKTVLQRKCTRSKTCKIEFKANKVIKLSDLIKNRYLDYWNLVSLFVCMMDQINFLYNENIGILFFDLDNIIAIETDPKEKFYKFAYVSADYLFEIDENVMLVSKSFDKKRKSIFLSPELITLNHLPFEVHFKTCYFSLAMLISYCINGERVNLLKPITWKVDDYKKILEPINNTKLFWALLRCLEIEPDDRFLLWI